MFNLEILDDKENLLLIKKFKYQKQLESWLNAFKTSQDAAQYIGKYVNVYFFVNNDKIIPFTQYNGIIEDPSYVKFKNDKVRRRGLLKR